MYALKKRHKIELIPALLCHATERILRLFNLPLLRVTLKPLSNATHGSLRMLELRLDQCVLLQKERKRQISILIKIGGGG